MRDKEWVHKMGHTPSIMDYARFNYVAQPEDGIAVEDLVPRIGPYDIWATKWGYTPIPSAKTADDEKPTLDAWAREQDKTPWLRFSTSGAGGSDPGDLTEAVGDADAIKSTALGLKNLQRVAKMLLTATTAKDRRALRRSRRALRPHAGPVDPGDEPRRRDRRRLRFPGEIHRAAGRALHPGAQGPPGGRCEVPRSTMPSPRRHGWSIPEILRRIEPTGVLSRVRSAQNSVLSSLLNSARFARLVEQEAIDPATPTLRRISWPPSAKASGRSWTVRK